jgi:hypothetical protein
MGRLVTKMTQVGQAARKHSHAFISSCKHMIAETMAGFLAILLFEAHREGWLDLIGNKSGHNEALQTFLTFL